MRGDIFPNKNNTPEGGNTLRRVPILSRTCMYAHPSWKKYFHLEKRQPHDEQQPLINNINDNSINRQQQRRCCRIQCGGCARTSHPIGRPSKQPKQISPPGVLKSRGAKNKQNKTNAAPEELKRGFVSKKCFCFFWGGHSP